MFVSNLFQNVDIVHEALASQSQQSEFVGVWLQITGILLGVGPDSAQQPSNKSTF